MRPLVVITSAYIVIIILASCLWQPGKPARINPSPDSVMMRVEQNLSENMSYGLPAETSALLRGIMLGEKTEIHRDIKDMFSNTGVMHILAVSGMNVGMVAAIFFFIFTKMFRLTKKYASFLLIFIVIIFGQITGSQASVNRAVVMAIVGLIAIIMERERDMLNSLALAALVLLVWDPRNLFDVGFQLSFAATLGIVLFAPKFMSWLKPAGRKAVLIDGGGSLDPAYDTGERRVAPYLWSQGINEIDTMILTHAHYNHLRGLLAILDRFK